MIIRRALVICSTVSSALLSSQAPEFTQQYRQRLGGALDELRTIVSDFDNDAAKLDLSREQALYQLASADEAFFQTRASSLQTTFSRFESLTRQQQAFNSLDPVLQPLALFTAFDQKIIEGTQADYQPALPLTSHGALWTTIGGLFGWLFTRVILTPFSRKKPNPSPKRKLNTPTR